MIKYFVSSTFEDMHKERDIINTEIYPAIKSKAFNIGEDVSFVDFRWGINSNKMSLIMKLCRNEIEDCIPRFIGIIGDRYGTLVSNVNKPISATEAEIRTLLENPVTEDSGVIFFFRNLIIDKECEIDRKVFFTENDEQRKALENLKKDIIKRFPNRVFYYDVHYKADGSVEGYDGFTSELLSKLTLDVESLNNEGIRKVNKCIKAYMDNRRKVGIEKPNTYKKLQDFLSDKESRVLILQASPGSGTSVLLSKLAYELSKKDVSCFYYPLGIVEELSQSYAIINTMYDDLEDIRAKLDTDIRQSLMIIKNKYNKAKNSNAINSAFEIGIEGIKKSCISKDIIGITNTLNYTSSKVVLIVDGIDKINHTEVDIGYSFIPCSKNCKLIISTHELASDIRKKLTPFYGSSIKEIKMEETSDEAELMIRGWLKDKGKRLNSECYELLINKAVGKPTLYLKAICSLIELMDETSYKKKNEIKKIISIADESISDLILSVYKRAASVFGFKEWNQCLCYIYVCNGGITRAALFELFGEKSKQELQHFIDYMLMDGIYLTEIDGLIKFSNSYISGSPLFKESNLMYARRNLIKILDSIHNSSRFKANNYMRLCVLNNAIEPSNTNINKIIEYYGTKSIDLRSLSTAYKEKLMTPLDYRVLFENLCDERYSVIFRCCEENLSLEAIKFIQRFADEYLKIVDTDRYNSAPIGEEVFKSLLRLSERLCKSEKAESFVVGVKLYLILAYITIGYTAHDYKKYAGLIISKRDYMFDLLSERMNERDICKAYIHLLKIYFNNGKQFAKAIPYYENVENYLDTLDNSKYYKEKVLQAKAVLLAEYCYHSYVFSKGKRFLVSNGNLDMYMNREKLLYSLEDIENTEHLATNEQILLYDALANLYCHVVHDNKKGQKYIAEHGSLVNNYYRRFKNEFLKKALEHNKWLRENSEYQEIKIYTYGEHLIGWDFIDVLSLIARGHDCNDVINSLELFHKVSRFNKVGMFGWLGFAYVYLCSKNNQMIDDFFNTVENYHYKIPGQKNGYFIVKEDADYDDKDKELLNLAIEYLAINFDDERVKKLFMRSDLFESFALEWAYENDDYALAHEIVKNGFTDFLEPSMIYLIAEYDEDYFLDTWNRISLECKQYIAGWLSRIPSRYRETIEDALKTI